VYIATEDNKALVRGAVGTLNKGDLTARETVPDKSLQEAARIAGAGGQSSVSPNSMSGFVTKV
jgi:hypothetical protein